MCTSRQRRLACVARAGRASRAVAAARACAARPKQLAPLPAPPGPTLASHLQCDRISQFNHRGGAIIHERPQHQREQKGPRLGEGNSPGVRRYRTGELDCCGGAREPYEGDWGHVELTFYHLQRSRKGAVSVLASERIVSSRVKHKNGTLGLGVVSRVRDEVMTRCDTAGGRGERRDGGLCL